MTEPPGLVFGPVPSRRLGRSLGINNLPGKTCSYACVYCQVGPTTCLRATRDGRVLVAAYERMRRHTPHVHVLTQDEDNAGRAARTWDRPCSRSPRFTP